MDILQYYEAIKIFIQEEKDTYLGLVLFLALGLIAVKYVLLEGVEQLQPYATAIMSPTIVVILIVWLRFRIVKTHKNKFNIAISQFNILMLDIKKETTSETKRNLRQELVDYVYSALHFNKEKMSLDKYLGILKLSPRFDVTQQNAKEICKEHKIELLIWGDAYYKEGFMYFKPRFEFLWEPTNVYYSKFKKNLNNLKTFKIDITKSLEKPEGELSELMHYLSFLGLMFNGIHLSHLGDYKKANENFELTLKKIKTDSFHNRSLSDIYLATRFFLAQNLHKWGNHILKEERNSLEAMKLYKEGAKSLFARAEEMEKMHDIDIEGKIEHSLLYGIYLLIKENKLKEAEKKLESMKNQFSKNNIYLYYLYKGFIQKNPKNALFWFDKSLKVAKNKALVDEKIADYFFSKGKFNESIKYFEERLKITPKQIYSPELLEEDAHSKLSSAYLKKAKVVSGLRERIIDSINERKNFEREN